jgi:oleate hydratase
MALSDRILESSITLPNSSDLSGAKVYLVGGGIASMAAAAFMIRDGDIPGCNITIIEELDTLGGSLDGAGSPESGYVLRGGRMLESKYLCTYELFSSIPTLGGDQTVTQEIFAWNVTMKTSSKSRFIRDGRRQTAPEFGLTAKDILMIEFFILEPEDLLQTTSIMDHFDSAFFKTNFWLMWCTTFAFQPWHSAVEFKRYLVRFTHMVDGFNRLEGIMRTKYNQYDSMVRPLRKWLDERDVSFVLNTCVTDLNFDESDGKRAIDRIGYIREGEAGEIEVSARDYVLVTLGSMTAASSLGDMNTAPILEGKEGANAWLLWEKIAAGRPNFGRPSVFTDHINESKWLSFTITLHDLRLLKIVGDLTGNVPGEGGLITFPDSGWLVSIVIPHQPHFIGQPDNIGLLWGYGLFVDKLGNFIKKPMSACTGREIMIEVLGHLDVAREAVWPDVIHKGGEGSYPYRQGNAQPRSTSRSCQSNLRLQIWRPRRGGYPRSPRR